MLTLARWAVLVEEHYSRPARDADADGYRMGEGWSHRRAVSGAGATGDRPHAARRDGAGALPPRLARRAAGEGPKRRREDWPGTCPGHPIVGGSGATSAWRGARHRDDRSRLGAGDETSGGRGHRPRRPHLPRRDRQPRAGHTRDRRHRNGHVVDHDGRRRDRVVRRRRRRLRLSRPAAGPCRADEPRGSAAATHPHDDERGEPRRGVLLVVPAQRRRRPGTPRVHHRHPRARAPHGAAAPRSRSPTASSDGRSSASQLDTPTRASTSSIDWPRAWR